MTSSGANQVKDSDYQFLHRLKSCGSQAKRAREFVFCGTGAPEHTYYYLEDTKNN